MAAARGITALVLGAVTRDLEVKGGVTLSRPGGVVHYAGMALARLGATTRVVTRVAPEDARELLQPLRAQGVETLALPSRQTTTYRNDYSGARDRHELLATSDPIGEEDIPEDWRRADLIQLGPLHRGDLRPDVAPALSGFKGIDLQGLVREPGPEGTRLRGFAELERFAASVDVVQASADELEAALGGESVERFRERHGVSEIIVTHGAGGAIVTTAAGQWSIHAPEARRLHPVGAGDVFLAAYLFLRCSGKSPSVAAEGAAEICGRKLESGEVPKGFRPGRRQP